MIIDLEHPFTKSWIHEIVSNGVVMSVIIVKEKEHRKGHCTKLIVELQKRYRKIIVPVPSDALISILNRNGFIFEPKIGHWVWRRRTDE